MPSSIIDLRPQLAFARPQPVAATTIKARDVVAWRNPNTGGHWSDLRVEFVYRSQGVALVRGHIGRLSVRTGEPIESSATVRLCDLSVTRAAGKSVL